MQQSLVIRGARPLCGEVTVGGSKNAALPLIFATVLTRGVCRLHHVPDIRDCADALSILSDMGARVSREGEDVSVDTTNMTYCVPDERKVGCIRASTYLLGACLGRFGRAQIQAFGGCRFSDRPIDLHLLAAHTFGARRQGDTLRAQPLRGGIFRPGTVSVGATVNALLMAVSAETPCRLYDVAREPHVLALIDFLTRAGACIRQEPDGSLTVVPAPLHGAQITVIPDMIEAGTYLLAGLITHGDVRIRAADLTHLQALFDVLGAGGVSVRVLPADPALLCAEQTGQARPVRVCTAPYPGFPTDLQPPLAVWMAQGGGGQITEEIFPDRFGYLDRLAAFGIRSDGRHHTARIYPSSFCAARTSAFDLRGGAAQLLAALCAPGQSVLACADVLARGYAQLVHKLRSIGAEVSVTETV